MKKFIKGVIISFVIIFATLTIIGYIYNKILYYMKEVAISSEEHFYNMFKENYGENAPVATLSYFQGYVFGQNSILQMQKYIIIISISFAIIIEAAIKISSNSRKKDNT